MAVSDGEERAVQASDLPAQRVPENGQRTPEQIAEDLARTRERLAQTVDTLVERTQPKAVAGRAAESLKEIFVDPVTGPRTDRMVKVGLVVVGTVGTLLVLRRLFRGRR